MNGTIDSPDDRATRRLTDAQLREFMRLIKGANSVELKVTVPASAHRATIQGLPMDPVEAQPRQIYFFDTPDLKLYNAGVVVRARRIAGGRGDTVVKLRPVEPDNIASDLKNDATFNIEVDALPGGFVCSASFKGRSTGQDIRDAVSGKKRLSKIFSKAQRAFYKQHAPPGVDMDSLQPLGPTFILKGRFGGKMGLDGKTDRSLVAEVWLYPDGSRILELSTKCLPAEALAVASETRAYLADHHVPTDAAQETKTRTALEFYSKALAAEIAAENGSVAAAPASAPKAAAPKSPAKRTPAKAAVKPAAAKPAPAKPAASKPQTNTSATRAAAKPATTARRATTTRRSASTARTTSSARTTRRAPGTRRKTSSSGS